MSSATGMTAAAAPGWNPPSGTANTAVPPEPAGKSEPGESCCGFFPETILVHYTAIARGRRPHQCTSCAIARGGNDGGGTMARAGGTSLAVRLVMANSPDRRELLVVEDHWPTARAYARVLGPLGTVVVVADADDAIRWVDGPHELAVIVCDADLPNGGAHRLRDHLDGQHQGLRARLVVVSRVTHRVPDDRAVVCTAGAAGRALLLRTVQQLSAM